MVSSNILIFKENYEQTSDDIVTCNNLVYSYTSALAFWIISHDWFYVDVLGEGWILSERLERISKNVCESLVIDFCCEGGETKVKEEGWIDVFSKLEIRLEM